MSHQPLSTETGRAQPIATGSLVSSLGVHSPWPVVSWKDIPSSVNPMLANKQDSIQQSKPGHTMAVSGEVLGRWGSHSPASRFRRSISMGFKPGPDGPDVPCCTAVFVAKYSKEKNKQDTRAMPRGTQQEGTGCRDG